MNKSTYKRNASMQQTFTVVLILKRIATDIK